MKLTRRNAIRNGAALLAGGSLALTNIEKLLADESAPPTAPNGLTPVTTPNGVTLPLRDVGGWKVGHLIAEEFEHEFAPGLRAHCWGYNGRTPGPTIEAVEGDKLRLYVTNRLPEPTSVHWHGILLPNGMDGVTGLNQSPIKPGETFKYEFILRNAGTHMYHSHFDEMTQQAMGLMGMFIIHPKAPTGPKVDRDFAIMLSEWRIDAGTSRPNPLEMTDFNVLTMNSKVYPATDPLVVRAGQRVRLRFGNLSIMDHHPIHLHGYQFLQTEIDGNPIPPAAQSLANTTLVPVGGTRAVEFVADELGDWAMHCHMAHHMMNQMGHNMENMLGVDTRGLDRQIRRTLPSYMSMGSTGMGNMMSMGNPENSIPMVGSDGPFGYIDMGGMFTILKVRENITSYDDPGWFQNPAGTIATVATVDEMRRDGIETMR